MTDYIYQLQLRYWKFRWWLADHVAKMPDKLRYSRETRNKWDTPPKEE